MFGTLINAELSVEMQNYQKKTLFGTVAALHLTQSPGGDLESCARACKNLSFFVSFSSI